MVFSISFRPGSTAADQATQRRCRVRLQRRRPQRRVDYQDLIQNGADARRAQRGIRPGRLAPGQTGQVDRGDRRGAGTPSQRDRRKIRRPAAGRSQPLICQVADPQACRRRRRPGGCGRAMATDPDRPGRDPAHRRMKLRMHCFCSTARSISAAAWWCGRCSTRLKASKQREMQGWQLVPVTRPYLVDTLTCAAQFMRYNGRSKTWVTTDAPDKVAEIYLARRGRWKLPVLTGIIHTPFLRTDGSICELPGYDVASGLLFKPDDQSFPPIPTIPEQGRCDRGTGTARASDPARSRSSRQRTARSRCRRS